jgi:hypothetical protein
VGGAGAVVNDLELERVLSVTDVDAGARLAGVLERVCQRLLDNPIRRELDPDRQLARIALDVELHRQAGLANLRNQGRQVGEPGLRRQRIACAAAEHADESAHLGQGAAADPLDRHQHFLRRAGGVVEDSALCPGLDDHHRDVVRDRVVQRTSARAFPAQTVPG